MIADSIRADLGVFVRKMQGMLLEGMIFHSNKKTRRSNNNLRVPSLSCRASKMPSFFLNQIFLFFKLEMISLKDARASESLVD
jgi:hypothetical protein